MEIIPKLIQHSPTQTDTMLYLLLKNGKVTFDKAMDYGVTSPTQSVRLLRQRGWIIDSIAKKVYEIQNG